MNFISPCIYWCVEVWNCTVHERLKDKTACKCYNTMECYLLHVPWGTLQEFHFTIYFPRYVH
jgi:hypothetical protein